MKAIILAAGVGRRLGVDHPKCLLEFNGRSLMQRHLDLLKQLGIEDVVVGVGHLADQVIDAIADYGHADFTRTLYNPRFEQGSMISLWTLREELAYGGDVLLMDADVLYDQKMLQRLIETDHENCFLLDRGFEDGDEPVKLCVRDGLLVEFRKQLAPDLDYEFSGESVGFFRFGSAITKRLAERTEDYLARGLFEEHYEEAIRDLMLETPEDFAFEDVTGIPWVEIDFPEDIERAKQEILPKLDV